MYKDYLVEYSYFRLNGSRAYKREEFYCYDSAVHAEIACIEMYGYLNGFCIEGVHVFRDGAYHAL